MSIEVVMYNDCGVISDRQLYLITYKDNATILTPVIHINGRLDEFLNEHKDNLCYKVDEDKVFKFNHQKNIRTIETGQNEPKTKVKARF